MSGDRRGDSGEVIQAWRLVQGALDALSSDDMRRRVLRGAAILCGVDEEPDPGPADELTVLSVCWRQLEALDRHARARLLLWFFRKHQNVGVSIDLEKLEQEAFEP